MSDNENFGFGKFVPGFDFLQNLAKGASQGLPQIPGLSSWIAPTMNVEELEKRISELKAVHFWLDQNSKALGATIQALEVQKMTLATLKGMNFNMAEVANALKLKAVDASTLGMAAMGMGTPAAGKAPKAEKAAEAAKPVVPSAEPEGQAASARGADKSASVVDPLQWWGALTQQFQQIAADAMKDAARNTGVDAARNMAAGVAKEAMKTVTGAGRSAAAKTSKPPARKTPAKRQPAGTGR